MKKPLLTSIFHLYYDGFSTMNRTSRKLWLIIFIKLFILFAILKVLFFPDFLKNKFKNDKERGDYVIEQLTNTKR